MEICTLCYPDLKFVVPILPSFGIGTNSIGKYFLLREPCHSGDAFEFKNKPRPDPCEVEDEITLTDEDWQDYGRWEQELDYDNATSNLLNWLGLYWTSKFIKECELEGWSHHNDGDPYYWFYHRVGNALVAVESLKSDTLVQQEDYSI
jgi:hypothetical protein